MEGARPDSLDCSAVVRNHVFRASHNFLYSKFREEVTRDSNAALEYRYNAALGPAIVNSKEGLLQFPTRNAGSAVASATGEGVTVGSVTLVGGTGFFGKFLAEQYLHRGVSVTVLARDLEKAKSIFVPIASGEWDDARRRSQGLVRLSSGDDPSLTMSSELVDDDRGRKVARYTYAVLSAVGQKSVTLELVEGDANNQQDLEYAMRSSMLVYYLVSALPQPTVRSGSWLPWRSAEVESSMSSYSGALRALDACRRVDAHFVALSPLWIHGSRLSPIYWYRRLWTHPWGYVSAVAQQEQSMLEQRGAPTPRCYFGPEGTEPPGVWRYWWSILRSTRLPEDAPDPHRSPVRLTLFRLSDIVHPSFNERMSAVKNNPVDDVDHMDVISSGDLDARLLASVMAKTLALCRSVVESRIDIAGQLRGGVDMRDTTAVLEAFEKFRNE